jgi:phytoene dehydrogenase-like protein
MVATRVLLAMEQIAVHVRPDVARTLHGLGSPSPASEELVDAASRLGVSLEPVHPGTRSPDLMTHFAVYVTDPETARRVADAVRRTEAVESAYHVPPAAPAAPPAELP